MRIRRACPDDRRAIEALHARARRALPQMWPWERHLADAVFVVVESTGTVSGALFAWPDESPVAWVRVAALDDGLDVGKWLALALPSVLDGLRSLKARSLAWLDRGGWAGPHLEGYGFEPLTDVVTLVKFEHNLPVVDPTSAHICSASEADVPAVLALDRAAFTPHWWQGEDTLRHRAAASAHFAVVEVAGKVIGYAEGELCLPAAHLNRIAVHPAHQGRGIGALLLRDALRAFWRQGAERVTLNTQSDNRFSQRLYHRFGFEETGSSATVWELKLWG